MANLCSYYDGSISKDNGKLRVLLEAAPQAAEIAGDHNRLPLHQILKKSSSTVTPEMVAMLLAAYKEAVSIPDDDGMLPIHLAARWAPPYILKMIAEENMSNLSVILFSDGGSVAHWAVLGRRLDNLRYIHVMMPELLLSVDESSRILMNHWMRSLYRYRLLRMFCGFCSLPLSTASDVLRFLLRHCPSLASARDINGDTLYDLILEDDARLAYARRLLLLAGASSLYPGVLQEMNYAARRTALLVFYSSATEPSIFTRIRYAAGGPVLMRSIVTFS